MPANPVAITNRVALLLILLELVSSTLLYSTVAIVVVEVAGAVVQQLLKLQVESGARFAAGNDDANADMVQRLFIPLFGLPTSAASERDVRERDASATIAAELTFLRVEHSVFYMFYVSINSSLRTTLTSS